MATINERRERERAQRHQLIVTAARELAEEQGWDAVTTRRLAERVEYSQPVLYSHFDGKSAIMGAVALDGFADLARRLGRARRAAPRTALRSVCRAYLDYATERPAMYQAMFVLPTDLRFAHADTPAPMRAAFDAFVACFGEDNPRREALAEIVWSALHGLVVLADSGRIPPAGQRERVDLLVSRFTD
ncbi:TetR family transcriptional regulator [Actinophytocola xinjiangensis]|uniref:TetR family transcriptional regulator n=1 Tax=Actinophytocola xinjiangensis TaxID=485602 RepID=A0A7Z0WI48_9PSEU|nr:TetR/AcrR family transcriptional regulator [Actinophytocola xinjiangensis]OLF07267.1 TetR family transcriptional regulator [Actinophytocola xinjiangensis]